MYAIIYLSTVDIKRKGDILASIKQGMERKENFSAIVNYLRKKNFADRKTISRDLKLSWGCVSELTAILTEKKILLEKPDCKSTARGKKSGILQLNSEVIFLGVDINKCGLKGCVCNLKGEKKEEFSSELNYISKNALISSVVGFVNSVTEKYPNITGIGFAMQGIFDKKSNVWSFPSDKENILIDFEKDFENSFNVPFIVEHDPNCILYGYLEQDKKSSMVIRIDSGIGATIYKDNEFLKNDPLEIGYMVFDGGKTRLCDIVSLKKLKTVLKEENSEKTKNTFFETGKYLGIALGNICNLLFLEKIYICGDMVEYYGYFQKTLAEYYSDTAFLEKKAEIEAVNVIDAAFGAAKIAMENFDWRK